MTAKMYLLLAGVFLLVVAVGMRIMVRIINRKWGYTPEREKELERRIESGLQPKCRKNR